MNMTLSYQKIPGQAKIRVEIQTQDCDCRIVSFYTFWADAQMLSVSDYHFSS